MEENLREKFKYGLLNVVSKFVNTEGEPTDSVCQNLSKITHNDEWIIYGDREGAMNSVWLARGRKYPVMIEAGSFPDLTLGIRYFNLQRVCSVPALKHVLKDSYDKLRSRFHMYPDTHSLIDPETGKDILAGDDYLLDLL